MIDPDRLKSENPIEDVITQLTGYELTGRGNYQTPAKGTGEGGLQINVPGQYYYWNAKQEGGDVISFVERQLNLSFVDACKWLAARAGLPWEVSPQQAAAYQARRKQQELLTDAARFFAQTLQASPAALAWAAGRGFTEETLKTAVCGFWDGNRRGLFDFLRLHGHETSQDLAQGLANMPAGMFIYAHMTGPRCVYLAGRSIEAKRHYNLPKDLAGDKQPFYNHVYSPKADHVVIVEGQADAVTLGQWGLAAVALAGAFASPELLAILKKHQTVYIALDQDQTGDNARLKIAQALGPLCKVVTWPAHDANDWLQAGATSDQARAHLAASPMFAEYAAAAVATADPLDQDQARRAACQLISRLSKIVYAEKRKELAKALDMPVTDLDRVVKEHKNERAQTRRGPEKPVKVMPGGYIDGRLFEIYLDESNPAGAVTAFAIRQPDGQITTAPLLELEHFNVEPPPAGHPLIESKALLLSPMPSPYGSLTSLITQIKAFIHAYVDLPPEFEAISAYYALFTWMYDMFAVSPYLKRQGDYGGGKSRWLMVMWALCYRSFIGNGASTIAPIFRILDQFKGTLLLDEADIANGNTERAADMLSILNSGHGADVGKVARAVPDGEGGYTEKVFSVYGPKLFSARRPFPDEATNSRCLTDFVSAGGYFRSDIPVAIDRQVFWQAAAQLRAQLLHYRLTNWQPQIDLTPAQNHSELPGRLREITLPMRLLFAEADDLQQDLDNLVTAANKEVIAARMQGLPAKILEGVLRAYYTPQPEAAAGPDYLRLAMKHLSHRVNLIVDSENAGDVDETDGDQARPKSRRRSVTPQSIGKRVRSELNLRTETDPATRLVYLVWEEERIANLCRRYGLDSLLVELQTAAAKEAAKPGQKQSQIDYGPMA